VAGRCWGRLAVGHPCPSGELGRYGLFHGFDHGPGVFLLVEVADDVPALVGALVAVYLPAGFGLDQVDLAPGYAPPAVVPLLDKRRHAMSSEQAFDGSTSVSRVSEAQVKSY
jgi:hypothetical protein